MRSNALFETEAFQESWQKYLASTFDIKKHDEEFVIYTRKMLKNSVPIRVLRVAGWNSSWSQEFGPERQQKLLAHMEKDDWDYFEILLTDPSDLESALTTFKDALKMHSAYEEEYTVDLKDGWEAYLLSQSQNFRKDVRKKFRRSEPYSPKLEYVTDRNEIDSFFEELFKHHIPYWKEKTGSCYFEKEEEREFAINWYKTLYDEGHLILDRLIMDGQVANLSVSIVYDDTLFWMLTINTGILPDCSPGTIGLQLRLQEAEKRGVRYFHMGPFGYRYKVQASTESLPVSTFILANPKSLKGSLFVNLQKYQFKQTHVTLPYLVVHTVMDYFMDTITIF